jgi:hypothetical protein
VLLVDFPAYFYYFFPMNVIFCLIFYSCPLIWAFFVFINYTSKLMKVVWFFFSLYWFVIHTYLTNTVTCVTTFLLILLNIAGASGGSPGLRSAGQSGELRTTFRKCAALHLRDAGPAALPLPRSPPHPLARQMVQSGPSLGRKLIFTLVIKFSEQRILCFPSSLGAKEKEEWRAAPSISWTWRGRCSSPGTIGATSTTPSLTSSLVRH